MFKISNNILDLIGKTPLLKIPTKEKRTTIWAKLETTNPTGSIKDRMAWFIVKKAEEGGELKPGSKIIEVTSGNTGISFAMIAAIKGYKFIAVMPKSVSVERVKMMKFFGAKVILTPAKDDIAGAIKKYKELIKKEKNAWLPRQFENPDNIAAHRKGIGEEIISQTGGKIDAFVAGVGTGGTLIGVAQALKKVNPKIKIIAVEPLESAVLSGGESGSHQIQGIGEGFIPKLVEENRHWIDEVIRIKSKDAISMGKKLARDYGILVGISSGANVLAAIKISKKFKNIVTVLPDRGERYLSLENFDI
ncbi:cysteine synthase A [Patescibacteria group bacterium]|nr:cysteine synthase A [Patescibacteria group bacterium]MBU4275009.1 cysteine synthase A [Patescibacteria group bacterium]MBU4367282.1 cysteine synthase A [Patescibacteria group bacterium]MBU4462001.1 cysteine synthase A [Patescibacteria group bacterium]MCG2700192.1 cysteine synthase A [Candidatus Parcubacteria bacterium]